MGAVRYPTYPGSKDGCRMRRQCVRAATLVPDLLTSCEDVVAVCPRVLQYDLVALHLDLWGAVLENLRGNIADADFRTSTSTVHQSLVSHICDFCRFDVYQVRCFDRHAASPHTANAKPRYTRDRASLTASKDVLHQAQKHISKIPIPRRKEAYDILRLKSGLLPKHATSAIPRPKLSRTDRQLLS